MRTGYDIIYRQTGREPTPHHTHTYTHAKKHAYRKGGEVVDEEDPGEDRGAVVVRVGVPLQPGRPLPVQRLEALRDRDAIRADGLACVCLCGCVWLGMVVGGCVCGGVWYRETDRQTCAAPTRAEEGRTILALVVCGDDLDEVLEEARAHRLGDELLLWMFGVSCLVLFRVGIWMQGTARGCHRSLGGSHAIGKLSYLAVEGVDPPRVLVPEGDVVDPA